MEGLELSTIFITTDPAVTRDLSMVRGGPKIISRFGTVYTVRIISKR
jgi:hypothetical protein